MAQERSPRRIQSVERAFDMLEALRDADGLSLTDLAERVDLSPGTAHTYLATMEEQGYVRSEDGEYHVGLFALPLGEYVRSRSRLYRAGKRKADALAAETGEVAHLVVESNGREIPLHERFGPDAVGEGLYTRIKSCPRRNLHCSAAGKAILAHLDEERREEILDGYVFASRTPATITDEASLQAELEQVREDGFAVNDEEQVAGLRAVGAPVVHDGVVEGAVSLSGPTSRMTGDRVTDAIPDLVVETANVIEVNLQSQRLGDTA